jgi:eukaryotic-like serine/threonine-protein kinase
MPAAPGGGAGHDATRGERLTDIGTVLGGRYRLVELLGQGGMATIYRARDNQLERDVAVKVLRPEYGADPDFIDRFRHEAQSAASLNHPGIVAVYDYGTDPAGPFIVMELVEGEDLATIIRRTGALPPRAAARLVAQAARALTAAHDRGFVHRDVKPGNILVTREGRVKVTDFGIARALSESALTLPGTTLGSVHYFSPEQARGELATQASDIYSLGIVLYELLTGRRPWTGDTAAAIATARLTGSVPSPSAVHGGIPPTLESIDRKALAPNPDERFASAAEMAEALEGFLGEERGDQGSRAAAAGVVGGAGLAGAAAGAAGAAGGASAAGAAGVAGAGAAAAGAASSPTIAAGVARPNPDARIDYPRDAYASATPARRGSGGSGGTGRRSVVDEEEEEERSGAGPWLWVTALAAIVILAIAGLFLSRILGGPGPSASPGQVAVPNLVGKTFEEAQQAASALGLTVQAAGFEQSSASPNTVIKQDPPEGTLVASGSAVSLTIANGAETTIVPDLRLKTEQEALNLIAQAGLSIGTRTAEFDAVVPEGSIVSQTPGSGQSVAKGTPVDYVVSKGVEQTPTPAPTPQPTPVPTQPPPPPTPKPQNVGDYMCNLLALEESAIADDNFTVGSISGPNNPDSWVIWQDPQPGTKRLPGTAIDLWTVDQPAPTTCPQPQ